MSMFLGILSIVLSIFVGIPAVILGHLSRASIRSSQGRLKGDGMATAGLITGYISVFLLPVLFSVVHVLVPNMFSFDIDSNEASALKTLSAINAAAASYKMEHEVYPASLQDLSEESLVPLDSQLARTGRQSGYTFTYAATASQQGFAIHADPVFIHTGQRHFYMDGSGIVRFEVGKRANGGSQPTVLP